jgi:hypothetical protein
MKIDDIANNPGDAKISKDIAYYRDALKNNPAARDEIKDKLKRDHPNPYAKPGFKKFETFTAYKDFGFERGPKAQHSKQRGDTLLTRLGGLLDEEPFFEPEPPPVPEPGSVIEWPATKDHDQTDIQISDEGAIIHTEKGDEEIPAAHEYMEEIFDFILYNTRNKLERINRALVGSNEVPPSKTPPTYAQALKDFQSFSDSLRPKGDSPYRKAFDDDTGVGIFPVVTNEGFIVSVRIELHWKNPFHSSSTIRVS